MTDLPDGLPKRKADGIDEPARMTEERDGLKDIPDDRTNDIDAMTNVIEGLLDVIDAMPDEPPEVTDQPADGGEVPDEATHRP